MGRVTPAMLSSIFSRITYKTWITAPVYIIFLFCKDYPMPIIEQEGHDNLTLMLRHFDWAYPRVCAVPGYYSPRRQYGIVHLGRIENPTFIKPHPHHVRLIVRVNSFERNTIDPKFF